MSNPSLRLEAVQLQGKEALDNIPLADRTYNVVNLGREIDSTLRDNTHKEYAFRTLKRFSCPMPCPSVKKA